MSVVTDELAAIIEEQRSALAALDDRVTILERHCTRLEATVAALRAITAPLIADDTAGDAESEAGS